MELSNRPCAIRKGEKKMASEFEKRMAEYAKIKQFPIDAPLMPLAETDEAQSTEETETIDGQETGRELPEDSHDKK